MTAFSIPWVPSACGSMVGSRSRSPPARERNDAWLVVDGDLDPVDLKTGKATMAGKIGGLTGKLTDIAWWE